MVIFGICARRREYASCRRARFPELLRGDGERKEEEQIRYLRIALCSDRNAPPNVIVTKPANP